MTESTHSHDNSPRILSLTIKDLSVLYSAYLPFVENGGLFIPMETPLEMGEEVFILLSLMDEEEKMPLTGRVVWITPSNSVKGKASGVGVQFKEKDNSAKIRIETFLSGLVNQKSPTHTM